MMKSCKILNVARLLALALVAVLLIPACLPVAHAATATKLALLMEAEKYQYIEGDMFDPEGLVLRVTYDDGTTQNITEGFTFDERPLTLEDEEVKITYEGMTVVQEIQVASAADALIIRFGSGDCIRCDCRRYPDEQLHLGGWRRYQLGQPRRGRYGYCLFRLQCRYMELGWRDLHPGHQ